MKWENPSKPPAFYELSTIGVENNSFLGFPPFVDRNTQIRKRKKANLTPEELSHFQDLIFLNIQANNMEDFCKLIVKQEAASENFKIFTNFHTFAGKFSDNFLKVFYLFCPCYYFTFLIFTLVHGLHKRSNYYSVAENFIAHCKSS